MIEITFDPRKDAANRRKHGLPLGIAVDFDMDSAHVEADQSQDYGEVRYVAIGWLRGQLRALTFTIEGDLFRIINLRYPSKSEIETYDENN